MNPTKPANRRTNLGILLLLAALALFGFIVAAINTAGTGTVAAARYGLGLGVGLTATLGLFTYAALLIRKATAKPAGA